MTKDPPHFHYLDPVHPKNWCRRCNKWIDRALLIEGLWCPNHDGKHIMVRRGSRNPKYRRLKNGRL